MKVDALWPGSASSFNVDHSWIDDHPGVLFSAVRQERSALDWIVPPRLGCVQISALLMLLTDSPTVRESPLLVDLAATLGGTGSEQGQAETTQPVGRAA